MPPELPQNRPQFFVSALPRNPRNCEGNRKMIVPGKKLIPILLLVLSCLTIARLVKIAIGTKSPRPVFSFFPSTRNQDSSNATKITRPSSKTSATETTLTTKEFLHLSNLVTRKAPCNLLVFGIQPQFLGLAALNAGGTTLFLEDDPVKISEIKEKPEDIHIYKFEYKIPAKKAYNLLKHARRNHACAPSSGPLQQLNCKLALRSLPPQVYETKWDVVVVDGPAGDAPEAPGRMATIYTAGLLARAGNATDVVVHDVHRTIEKWFSWEFLCEKNLISAKGRLWNFRITGESNSKRFCSYETVEII